MKSDGKKIVAYPTLVSISSVSRLSALWNPFGAKYLNKQAYHYQKIPDKNHKIRPFD